MSNILKFAKNEFDEKDWDEFGKGLDVSEEEKEKAEAEAQAREVQHQNQPK